MNLGMETETLEYKKSTGELKEAVISIASILYYSKNIESFGTGLKRIVDACKESKCRCEFEVQKSGFVVIFYRSETESRSDDPINEQINEQINEHVKTRENELIAYLRKKPSATYSDIASELDISYITARRLIQSLLEAGKVKRIGSKKKGGWKLID